MAGFPRQPDSALGLGELGQKLLGKVVLTLTRGEADQLQAPRGDEAMDIGDERLGHRIYQRRGRVVLTAVADEEALDPTAVGQPRLPDVEIHPVEGLHLEHHMIVEDISDTARYAPHGSGRTGGQLANQPLPAVHTPDRHAGHGLAALDARPRRPEPPAATSQVHAFGHGAKPG